MVFACFTPRPPQGAGVRQKSATAAKHEQAVYNEEPLQSNPIYSPAKPTAGHGAKAMTGKFLDSAEQRSTLANILKEHCLVESGEEHVAAWMKEEGYSGSVSSLTQSLDEAMTSDLLFWGSRYHLFVSWSPDRSHPWDALPAAGQYATLEVGRKRGTKQLVVLLEGKPVEHYTFKNSIFKTTAAVEWETPSGAFAHVDMELQFSAFFGYGQTEGEVGYLGLQCHGVLWPVADAEQPHYWPISPPIVSGKVNIAGRDAATSPGNSDSLAAFAGTYTTHSLPTPDNEQVMPGAEIVVKVNSQGQPEVAVAGRDLSFWTFDANNVLAWEDEAGLTAWLQFVVLPGGPVFMGYLRAAKEEMPQDGKFRVFGELLSQPSRLAPDGAMDSTVGVLVAEGLATSATILCASLLRTALKCWRLLKTGMGPEDVLSQEEDMLVGMRRDFESLERVQAATYQASRAFPSDGHMKELDPEVTKEAVQAEGEAAEQAQAARISADAVATAVALTNDCIKDGNAVEATSKAAASAWRASQAAAAAAQAEESALMAAKYAAEANTSAALAASVSAAQSFNLAKDSALAAARAEAAAANNALKTVETGINFYAMRKEYLKLKDIAEASDVAGKALAFANEAVEGWEAGTVSSRGAAQEAAKQAAEYSQLAHKLMRVVYRAK